VGAITIRNLDDDVQRRLKQRAAAHDQSMEAEVREILSAAVGSESFAKSWLALAERHRGVELELPSRVSSRTVDFS
jgi:plasmid stability protein